MSKPMTPEERAEKRYPNDLADDMDMDLENNAGEARHYLRTGFSTAIREEVEPLEAEVAKLRALVQVLTRAGDEMCDELRANDAGNGSSEKGRMDMYRAWDAAKEAGFSPTNTEDNG